jgi:hypothetical protein
MPGYVLAGDRNRTYGPRIDVQLQSGNSFESRRLGWVLTVNTQLPVLFKKT